MPTIKKSTESDLQQAIDQLTHELRLKHRNANKRDYWIHGTLFVALVIIAGVSLLTGNLVLVLWQLSTATWVAVALGLNLTINQLHYMVNMMNGLRGIENKELEIMMAQQPAKPAKATA